MSLKILVTGDVDGNMSTLFKKIDSVNKKVRRYLSLINEKTEKSVQ